MSLTTKNGRARRPTAFYLRVLVVFVVSFVMKRGDHRDHEPNRRVGAYPEKRAPLQSGPVLAENTLMSRLTGRVFSAVVLGAGLAFLYRDVFPKLVHDWGVDENYSHGFLIVPIALYLAWERRGQLAAARSGRRSLGRRLVRHPGSVAVLGAGILGAELFLTRISMLGVLARPGAVPLRLAHLRILAFPLAFLLLMIPIPAIIFNQIAFPLQLLASRFGEADARPRRRPGAPRRQRHHAQQHQPRGGRSLQRHPLAHLAAHARDRLRLLRGAAATGPASRWRSPPCPWPSSPTASAWPAPASPPTSSAPRPRRASSTRSPAGWSSSSRSSCCSPSSGRSRGSAAIARDAPPRPPSASSRHVAHRPRSPPATAIDKPAPRAFADSPRWPSAPSSSRLPGRWLPSPSASASKSEPTPPRESFATFPMQLGEWRGSRRTASTSRS